MKTAGQKAMEINTDLAERIRKTRSRALGNPSKSRSDEAKKSKAKVAELRAELRQLQIEYARLADRNHVLTDLTHQLWTPPYATRWASNVQGLR